MGPPSGPELSPPREPRFTREQIVAGVLAASGIVVTLIGVILLLALAARQGLLTRPVRVGGGAVLAAALAGAAAWVWPKVGGRIGSVAMLATGVAAAYFDVVAVTRLYHWVPLPVGLTLASGVAVAAGALAVRWRERLLFQAVVVAVAGLAPFLTGGATEALAGFLIVLQLVGVLPERRCGWEETALTRTVPAALVALTWAVDGTTDLSTAVVIAASVGLVGLGAGVLSGLARRDQLCAPIALALSWLPLLALGLRDDVTAWLSFGMTLATAAALVPLARIATPTRYVVLALTACSGLSFAVRCAHGDWRALPFFAAALVAMAAHQRLRNVWVGRAGVAVFVLAVLVQGTLTPYVDLFYRSRVANLPASTVLTGVAMIVFAVLAAAAVRGRAYPLDHLRLVLGAAGGSLVLGLASVVIGGLGHHEAVFFPAHLTLTVLVFGLVAVVLTAGLTHPRLRSTSITAGLALGACAVAKLFLFDLAYMSPVTKILTFLATGVVLLATGTVYARRWALSGRNSDGTPTSIH